MKHVTQGQKSLFMPNAMADTLVEFARVVAEQNRSESVTLPAIGVDGKRVDVTFLLTPTTDLVVETTDLRHEVLGEEDAVDELRERTTRMTNPPPARPAEPSPHEWGYTDE